MPKPMSKPRKYQITPNAITPIEEASVKSVLDRFRNRAPQSEAVDPAVAVRGVVDFPSDISKAEIFGYPKENDADIQISDIGNPTTATLDIHSEPFGDPKGDALEIQAENIGKPTAKTLARKLSEAKNVPGEAASDIAKSKTLASQNIPETGKWKKYDKARSTETVFVRADADLVNRVKHFNVEYKLQMREFFELAATAFMDTNSKPNAGNLASNIASDDRGLKIRLFKSEKRIINLYEAYNQIFSPGSVWSLGDDKIGVRYNEIPIEIVEMGIMHCQINKLESDPECRINSFKYYTKQITQYLMYADFDPKMLQMMVETGRRRWREATGREVDLGFLEVSE